MGNGLGGMTRFAATRGGYRYVRITILRTLPSNERAAILGHELQHATEIACSPASTAAAVRALFNRIGQAVAGARDVFETRAAEEVTASVWLELHGRREQRTTDKGRRTERRTWN
jgi:predicted Zn-dependent protease